MSSRIGHKQAQDQRHTFIHTVKNNSIGLVFITKKHLNLAP